MLSDDGDPKLSDDGDPELSDNGDPELSDDGDPQLYDDDGNPELSYDGDLELSDDGDPELSDDCDPDLEVPDDSDSKLELYGNELELGGDIRSATGSSIVLFGEDELLRLFLNPIVSELKSVVGLAKLKSIGLAKLKSVARTIRSADYFV